MRTFYSLFRGGNLVGFGAEDAGLIDIGGVEMNPKIAACCDVNFPDALTTVANVCEVDPTLLSVAPPTDLHASPECDSASTANQSGEVNEKGTKETENDRDCGRAVCRFIEAWQPERFTLENVWFYRKYDAFKYTLHTLKNLGYSYRFWHLNSADYGVPQTRKRLMLVARRGEYTIQRPTPTHHNPKKRAPGQASLFEITQPWNGWYQAIEDLIPELPDSEFANWQIPLLPKEIKTALFSQQKGSGKALVMANGHDPAFTITGNTNQAYLKAFIVDGQNSGANNGNITLRDCTEPMFTVTGGIHKGLPRAYLIGDTSGQMTPRTSDEPAFTIRSFSNEGGALSRAFLISSIDGTSRADIEPATTIVGIGDGHSIAPRAWLAQGRVVKMSARALARFQSIPNRARLNGNDRRDCEWIGNGVPSKLYEIVVRGNS